MSASLLSFDAIFGALRSATPAQQWEFKQFLEGIKEPVAAAPAPKLVLVPATEASSEEKKPVEKKAPRKATKATEVAPVAAAEEAALLAPVDAPAPAPKNTLVAAAAPAVENKYRLAVVNPALCIARKIDKKAPIPGTRPEDAGSNGKFYPELQCSKKPVAGSKMCKICAEKHAEAQKPENAMKAIDSYYGLLDEKTLYWNSQIVGSDKFKAKYPKGLPSLATTDAAAPAPAPVAPVEKPVEKAAEPVAEAKPAAKKPVKKATKATAAADEVTPTTRKAKAPPAPSEADEWEEFLYEGVSYIRHKVTNNCYLVNSEETEPVRMVRRDCFEGKWKDGELDRYAAEDD
jgi:hypothetical protein